MSGHREFMRGLGMLAQAAVFATILVASCIQVACCATRGQYAPLAMFVLIFSVSAFGLRSVYAEWKSEKR
jgi:hypothetical protein